ncbi:MAG: DUF2511 domain-containing protein [Nocardioidaceae bacterium]|nr:DUF2511 domain-containing protein [Nocardioidaceae bacterium]
MERSVALSPLLAAVLLSVSACGLNFGSTDKPAEDPSSKPDPAVVSREIMGKNWPLTVEDGRLLCMGANGLGAVLFVAPDGTSYALNNAPNQPKDATDVDAILADSSGGRKKDITPLVLRGLKLCD